MIGQKWLLIMLTNIYDHIKLPGEQNFSKRSPPYCCLLKRCLLSCLKFSAKIYGKKAEKIPSSLFMFLGGLAYLYKRDYIPSQHQQNNQQ